MNLSKNYEMAANVVKKIKILFKLGDLIAARTAYDDAIRLQPDFSQAYASQAKVFDALAEQSRDRFKQLASEFYRRADEAKEKSERGE